MPIPTQKSTAILSICKVSEPQFAADGTVIPGNKDYYFLSSYAYTDTGVAKATGVTVIDPDKWLGQEPLIKLDQMILSGKLERIYVDVDPGSNKSPKTVATSTAPTTFKLFGGASGVTAGCERKNTTTACASSSLRLWKLRDGMMMSERPLL